MILADRAQRIATRSGTMPTLMLLSAMVGMYGGHWIRHALSPRVFRTCFLVSLLMLGAHMLVP